MTEKKEATKANDKDNKDTQPKKTNDNKPKGRGKRKGQLEPIKPFSLKGKNPEQQREAIEQEINRLKGETKKLEEKLVKVNDKLKENDWKKVLERFSPEEIKAKLGL